MGCAVMSTVIYDGYGACREELDGVMVFKPGGCGGRSRGVARMLPESWLRRAAPELAVYGGQPFALLTLCADARSACQIDRHAGALAAAACTAALPKLRSRRLMVK